MANTLLGRLNAALAIAAKRFPNATILANPTVSGYAIVACSGSTWTLVAEVA